MTVSAGIFRPSPVVTVAGAQLAAGAAAGGRAGLVALDGVSIDWGRDELLDQPDPATGTLRVFDPTLTWATATDRRGQAVTLAWTGVVEDGSTATVVYFRGRIGSPVQVVRQTVVYPDGSTVTGSLVTLPIQSVLVDFANQVPTIAWPAETIPARASRLKTATGLSAVKTNSRTTWVNAVLAPVAAADQVSLWDHLVALYNSCGADRMTYLPDTHSTEPITRRESTTGGGGGFRTFGQLWWDGPGQARYGQGVYVRGVSSVWSGGSYVFPATYLDAGALEYDPADGLTQPAKITRLQLSHPDAAAGYAERVDEAIVSGADEVTGGIRAARLESLASSNADAAQALSDLEAYVLREGSQWRLQTLRWTTRKTGGFETVTQGRLLLRGAEREDAFFLQRSWVASFGLRPAYGVIGGRITFEAGGWDLEFDVSPISLLRAQHAITFEEVDDGSATYQIEWWDEDHPRGIHESVTFEDLGHVGQGLAAAIGSDTGWDVVTK